MKRLTKSSKQCSAMSNRKDNCTATDTGTDERETKKNTKRNKNESTKKTMKISRAQTNEKELVHRITQIENDAMSKAIRFAEHRLLTLADQ